MIFQLNFPDPGQLDRLIAAQKGKPFSYPKSTERLKGFDYDDNLVLLGEGDAVFEAGCAALRRWAMFPGGWARLYSDATPIEIGRVVVMYARILGLWWLNVSRIVYTVGETHRFGFAYGTLAHHAERGEELFQIEMDDEGRVWYRIRAFSQPRFWGAQLAYPFSRHLQRRFIRESLHNMKTTTHGLLTTH